MRYAKLAHKVGENPDIGDAMDDNPRAVALFLISLARCDVYGILPADPRRYKIAVVPGSELKVEAVADALDEQERRGWIRRYTDSEGTQLLHILKYHEYQDVRWARVGPPERELPDWWQPPEDLMKWLLTLAAGDDSPARRAWGAVLDRYCGTCKPVENSTPTPGLLPDVSRPGHGAPDKQTQTHTHTQNDSTTLASAEAAACPKPSARKQQSPVAQTAPRPETPVQQIIRRAWNAYGFEGTPPSKGYFGLVKLVQTKGIPLLEEFLCTSNGSLPRLPEGAEPGAWFGDQLRAAMNKPWEWQPKGRQRASPAARTQPPMFDHIMKSGDD